MRWAHQHQEVGQTLWLYLFCCALLLSFPPVLHDTIPNPAGFARLPCSALCARSFCVCARVCGAQIFQVHFLTTVIVRL